MPRIARAVLYGIGAILAVDTLGSLASREFDFEYMLLAPLGLLVYGGLGAYIGRTDHPRRAVIAGGLVGLVESTIGWAISIWIGPGMPETGLTNTVIVSGIMFTTLIGAGLAGLGASLAERRRAGAGGADRR